MTPERWERIESILLEASALGDADREAYLGEACGGDQALRSEVESLLQANARAASYIKDPLLPPEEPPDQLSAGHRIGPYRIHSVLGRGGMGAVYLAVRADQEFDQQVALKILMRRLQGASGIRRFRRERQILARLEHPNIASLKDGGTTGDDRPYFVMEYVEGEPIHRYCDYRGLGISDRLLLMEKVCAAVHFFHQNLVLHRDLKPNNILVKEDGEPKILDFGIARLLQEDPDTPGEPRLVGPTPFTPMTLAYASPEQLRGDPLSTASDIYALGILLYKLLTAHSPSFMQAEGNVPSADDLWAPPVLPSLAPSKNGSSSALPFSRRDLAGDLDSIVMKALAENPRQRYISAQQLADDLRHHREGRPVLARQQSVTYRLGRFLKRHKAAVFSWLLISLLLVILSFHLKRLKDLAVEQTLLAESKSVEAEIAKDFMVEIFESTDVEDPEEAIDAVSLLDQASLDFEERFQKQPGLLATLRGAIGRAYLGLHRHAEAEPLLTGSLELREAIAAPAEEIATSAQNLARLRRYQGRLEESTALARKAWSLLGERGKRDPQMARAANLLARSLVLEDQRTEAESFFQRSLSLWEEQPENPHPEKADVHNDYGDFLRQQGRIEEAEAQILESLRIYKETAAPRTERIAIATANLAGLSFERGDYARARALFEESREVRSQIYGPNDPAWVPLYNSLGRTMERLGRYQEALGSYDEALRLLDLAPQSLRLGIVLRNKAELLLWAGRHREAEEIVRRALDALREAQAANAYLWDAKSVLGACLINNGSPERGLELLEDSLQALREDMGEDHRWVREASERLQRFNNP